ncbi:histidinol-phosphate transaminase [Shinella sp. CPCC 101442]|uniref:histidinol-phosphate transaminase n=1 Tax=Shinella sp. CPCC 101442 TaxID=2932265 RepID=UPI0021538C03|nr:histidinol-phosphate transaminase [Shinella sp. CPCC 101442]MCR6502089.1 histidinol-phosphate transaminase [Shinella sp. CPCC 101442]
MAENNLKAEEANGPSARPALSRLPPYNAGVPAAVARRISGKEEVICLGSNENPYGTSPSVGAALWGLVPSRYSDSTCAALREAISDRLGVAAERIVCGNGSEELIAALCRAYLEPADHVLTVSPCFGLHEIEPMAAGVQVIKVAMTEDLDFDVEGLIAALAKVPKIFFISSPSNPVGQALSGQALSRLADAIQPGTIFVLDEAYAEFVAKGLPDGLAILNHRSDLHWAVLRTFSKAYGLAGLRVGYAITSHPGLARTIRATLTPFNVNAVAQTAAVAALRDTAWMIEATTRLRYDRDILADRIRRLGLRVIPSQANFLFIALPMNAATVAGVLLQKGIVVKPWMETGYTNFIRVTIGTAEQNEHFARELEGAVNLR